jgi:hypothetical protein
MAVIIGFDAGDHHCRLRCRWSSMVLRLLMFGVIAPGVCIPATRAVLWF